MARFRAADLVVESKPDLTPVTDADRAAEELVRLQLKRTRPRDAVEGEEFEATGHGPRRWVIDPIDGTKNFVRGVPVWATLIGLVVDDVPVVGARRRAGAAASLVGRDRLRRLERAAPCRRPRASRCHRSDDSATPRCRTRRSRAGGCAVGVTTSST